MADNSKIQWTEATWNPWHGCTKVSHGCKYCYMYRDKDRYGQDPTKVLKSKSSFNAPLKWEEGKLIFTCSWSDWFVPEADQWRKQAWKIIKNTPQHTYQILTKRPERIEEFLPEDWGEGYDNVWLGVSVENQEMANLRMPILAMIPAKVKFLSVEPIIGRIELAKVERYFTTLKESFYVLPCFDWVIVGGESGNETGKYRYRSSENEWYTKVVKDCQDNDVPVFIKQLGTHLSKELQLQDRHGGNIDEWPEELRVREFPRNYKKNV